MVRIKDIAREAGVSPTTVSNVIHGNTKKVSKANIDKIQRILEKNQYIPSMSALMLAENRSRLIGVLIGEREGKRRSIASDPFTSVILNSLELEIYRQNYYMLFHLANSQEESWKLAATWKVEGLITLGLSSEENLELSEKCQIPLVSIDNYYGEKKVANIGLQDFEGGYAMGRFLAEEGHKDILFLADNDVGVDHERWLGVQRAVGEYGAKGALAGRKIMPENRELRKAWLEDNLEELKSRDVLFFASDFYALEAIHVLQDKGIEFPGAVSGAGFDDSPSAETCRPESTSVRQNIMKKGQEAVKRLTSLIQGEEFKGQERLPVEVVIRDSVKRKRL